MTNGLTSVLDSFAMGGGSLTTGEIIVSLLLTLVITLGIFYIYRKTYSGPIYSHEFNVTLVIVALVVTVVMLGISRNLTLSLGLVGALSIVRFRNAVKDSKDVAYIFWAITVGIVNGVQFYKLSIIASILIGIVILVFSKKFRYLTNTYILVLKYAGSLDTSVIEDILEDDCKKYGLKNSTLSEDSNELVYEVRAKDEDRGNLLKRLKRLKGVRSVNLFSNSGELGD